MASNDDAFGQSLWDAFSNRASAMHVIEREDGFVDPDDGASYLSPPAGWTREEHMALRLARGRVLDIGCGAGRHSLELQRRGLSVVGIDISPLAVKTARARGLKDVRRLSITQISERLGEFDTVLTLGNNFGLFANFERARRLLRRLYHLTSPDARVIAQSNDIYRTTNASHLAYQRENRRRGRMSGQIRFRVRYKHLASPYFDYLMVSPGEMREIVSTTGWHIARLLKSRGSLYIAVLEKRISSGQHSRTKKHAR